MFKLEQFGYKKSEVNEYLVGVLEKLDEFEKTISRQKDEIKSLEKHIEVLNYKKEELTTSENYIKQAKENADHIINQALLDINDLDDRIHDAILRELDK